MGRRGIFLVWSFVWNLIQRWTLLLSTRGSRHLKRWSVACTWENWWTERIFDFNKFRGSSSHFCVDHFYIVDFHSALTFPDRVYRKAELVECAVIPDSIFSLIIQSASAVCFLSHLLHNPAVCYHCFEQCVDAQSPNDCNFQLVGSTLFRKFLSKLIFQVFISTILTI